jgi:hypothetical protein
VPDAISNIPDLLNQASLGFLRYKRATFGA